MEGVSGRRRRQGQGLNATQHCIPQPMEQSGTLNSAERPLHMQYKARTEDRGHGQYSSTDRRCRHKTEETENCQRTPNTQPGEEGWGGGKGLAEEDRELPVQCLHSHSHTNRTTTRTLDPLNNVEYPHMKGFQFRT